MIKFAFSTLAWEQGVLEEAKKPSKEENVM